MRLRKLRVGDAPLMLEWMHDDSVVQYLREDFANKTTVDCLRFITEARDETECIHFAIADDNDEYMGTVSLKYMQQNTAELGISLRACAMGLGYASFGIREMMEYGYKSKGIDTVYWCVDPKNCRAIRFYEKHGITRCDPPEQTIGYTDEEKCKYIWYRMDRNR